MGDRVIVAPLVNSPKRPGMVKKIMRIRVTAESDTDYARWSAHQLEIPPKVASGDTALGALLFEQLTCANCHAISGTSAKGTTGPDLSHLADRQTLAAGVLENTPSNLERWLADPQAVKPKGCEYCHEISGYGGHRGPDLTYIGDRFSVDQLTIQIVNGGTNMPAYGGNLSTTELNNLVAFLGSRKAQ